MRKTLPMLLLFVVVPGLVLAGGEQGTEKLLVVDAFDGDGPKLGTSWETYNDENNLGTKVNPFEIVKDGSPKGAKGHGHFSGHIGKNKDPWPWAVLDLAFGNDAPMDLTEYKSLRFWVKGDGKKYRVRLARMAIEDYCHYEYIFTAPKEWTLVTAPLNDFAQPKWGKQVAKGYKDVTQIGFVALNPGNDEDFDLRFTNVEFVAPAPAKK
jgi:hypothetical protein